jgi:hypothetical protein
MIVMGLFVLKIKTFDQCAFNDDSRYIIIITIYEPEFVILIFHFL